jgi:hypothetical protein
VLLCRITDEELAVGMARTCVTVSIFQLTDMLAAATTACEQLDVWVQRAHDGGLHEAGAVNLWEHMFDAWKDLITCTGQAMGVATSIPALVQQEFVLEVLLHNACHASPYSVQRVLRRAADRPQLEREPAAMGELELEAKLALVTEQLWAVRSAWRDLLSAWDELPANPWTMNDVQPVMNELHNTQGAASDLVAGMSQVVTLAGSALVQWWPQNPHVVVLDDNDPPVQDDTDTGSDSDASWQLMNSQLKDE